jgi:hypothetical protein
LGVGEVEARATDCDRVEDGSKVAVVEDGDDVVEEGSSVAIPEIEGDPEHDRLSVGEGTATGLQ